MTELAAALDEPNHGGGSCVAPGRGKLGQEPAGLLSWRSSGPGAVRSAGVGPCAAAAAGGGNRAVAAARARPADPCAGVAGGRGDVPRSDVHRSWRPSPTQNSSAGNCGRLETTSAEMWLVPSLPASVAESFST